MSLDRGSSKILPCEIVVELFALFLDILEDGSDHPDYGNDETAKGNCAQVKDLPRINIGREGNRRLLMEKEGDKEEKLTVAFHKAEPRTQLGM